MGRKSLRGTAKRLKARLDRLEEALPRAYALGVYDQQHSAEKLDPAKTYEFHRATLTDTREGDARAKGHAWYDSVCREGELMLDVAARLGMTVAQVSAIRQGRAPIPREEASE